LQSNDGREAAGFYEYKTAMGKAWIAGKQALAKQVFVFTEEHTNKNRSCEATTDAKRQVFMSIMLALLDLTLRCCSLGENYYF